MKKNKGVVFDRDGTLIEYIPYLFKVKEVRLINGARKLLKSLKNEGFRLFLHTNQSGVGRGLYSLEDVKNCNNEMLKLLNLGQDLFDRVCIAEDFPPSIHSYRKPSARFANEIIKKYNIERSNLFYIGDNISDLETAQKAGCNAFGINQGVHDLKIQLEIRKDMDYIILNNLSEVSDKLIT
tara:strand:+ start:468 stop:1010 length:543 start_codon:yes stop_codon:yes gene_type:complete